MNDRLPKDLEGGWEFDRKFQAVPLKAGQIWRKAGPVDALKIVRVMMPGHSEFDGASQGISIRPTRIVGAGRIKWSSQTWFRLGNEAQIHEFFEKHGYALV